MELHKAIFKISQAELEDEISHGQTVFPFRKGDYNRPLNDF